MEIVRSATEPLTTLLARLEKKLQAKAAPKGKYKGGVKPAGIKACVLATGQVVVAGEMLPTAAEGLQSGRVLRIQEMGAGIGSVEDFLILVNAVSIRQARLPTYTMVGYPVVPEIQHEGRSDHFQCEYFWYAVEPTSEIVALLEEEAPILKARSTLFSEEVPFGRPLGREEFYTPTAADVGKLLVLQLRPRPTADRPAGLVWTIACGQAFSLGSGSKSSGASANISTLDTGTSGNRSASHTVRADDAPYPFLARERDHLAPRAHSDDMRLVTYNVLADYNLRQEFSRKQQREDKQQLERQQQRERREQCTCELTAFEADHSGYSCDGCGYCVRVGEVVRGCRACDFDLCVSCFGSRLVQKEGGEAAVPHPAESGTGSGAGSSGRDGDRQTSDTPTSTKGAQGKQKRKTSDGKKGKQNRRISWATSCPPGFKIERRRQILCREMLLMCADVLMLQEVDSRSMYEEYFRPVLAQAGYSGWYANKISTTPLGCATFYSTRKFELLHEHTVDLGAVCSRSVGEADGDAIADGDAMMMDLFEAHPELATIMQKTTTVAQITFLLVREDSGISSECGGSWVQSGGRGCSGGSASAAGGKGRRRGIVAVNNHLFGDPYAPHIRLLQTALVLNTVRRLMHTKTWAEQLDEAGVDWALVFGGDLNAGVDSGACELLVTGVVDATHDDWKCAADFSWGKLGEKVSSAAAYTTNIRRAGLTMPESYENQDTAGEDTVPAVRLLHEFQLDNAAGGAVEHTFKGR
jgi:mRNA deadenylase 3'-5' endonuclease subunit Ccr4